MTTVVVAAAIANKPGNAGNAWSRLAWLEGFASLGCETYLVETIVDPTAAARQWFDLVAKTADVPCVLSDVFGRAVAGDITLAAADILSRCDILLNVSGHLRLDRLPASVTTVFLDDDPGFTQIWAQRGLGNAELHRHNKYLTYATNIGGRDCRIPTLGLDWHPLLPPVALRSWQQVQCQDPETAPFTTIGAWRGGYGAVVDGVTTYGVKAHEFRHLVELPSLVPSSLHVALDIHPGDYADSDALVAAGWQVSSPSEVVGDLHSYREWIGASAGEISAAQGMYVTSRSGWFSDRSGCYLATGRPVVLQDTGVVQPLSDARAGWITFDNLTGAATALQSVLDNYEEHANAARRLAEELLNPVRAAALVVDIAGDTS